MAGPFISCSCRRSRLTRLHGKNTDSSRAAGHPGSPAARSARGALSQLCALDHHAPRVARRARRAEAGSPPHPLWHAAAAARPRHCAGQVGEDRRRRDGHFPSARRRSDLRSHGAARAGFFLALPAGRRPGQFWQYRRRWRCGLSLHRSAHDRRRAADARWHRRGRGRVSPELRRQDQGAGRSARRFSKPAGERLAGHRGRHGDRDPAAQRRRALRRRAAADQEAGHQEPGAPEIRQGSGFSDRRHRCRQPRLDRRGLHHRPRLVSCACEVGAGGGVARHLGRRGHRDSLAGPEVAADRKDRRAPD